MGKINKGILGGISGRIGSVSGCRRNGKDIIRSLPTIGDASNKFKIQNYLVLRGLMSNFYGLLSAVLQGYWYKFPVLKWGGADNFTRFHISIADPVFKYGSPVFYLFPYLQTFFCPMSFNITANLGAITLRFIPTDFIKNYGNQLSVRYIFATVPNSIGTTTLFADIRTSYVQTAISNAQLADSNKFLVLDIRDIVANQVLARYVIPCGHQANVLFEYPSLPV